jgi:hypothetical protein
MNEHNKNEQFQQWLLLYVNGQLDDLKTAWMEEYVAEHPDAATEVEIERALKSTLLEQLPDYLPDQGLETLMHRIQVEERTFRPTTASKFNKFLTFCKEAIDSMWQNPKWAIAVIVLLLQTGVIATFINDRTNLHIEQNQWRSVSESSRYQGPVLQITFKPTSTEADIRMLLVKIRGSLVGGPGQLGQYLVRVPENTITETQNEVMKSEIIESVQVLPELPIEHE